MCSQGVGLSHVNISYLSFLDTNSPCFAPTYLAWLELLALVVERNVSYSLEEYDARPRVHRRQISLRSHIV
jgi:hypothetical protein